MSRCETVDRYGDQCHGQAYGDARQCVTCASAHIPPCPEYVFTVVANDHEHARQLFHRKIQDFMAHYPGIRMILAGETHEYRWTKARKEHIGQRQHWVRYALARA